MTSELRQINISEIDAHPNNPRLVQREDVIEAIKTNINGHGFDPAFAVLVRPKAGRFEIISGHHRHEAAKRAGVPSVAAWVREMDDATAYMELVKSNAQGELTALERGLHALHSGMDVKAYAESVGRARKTVSDEVLAARVAEAVAHVRHDLSGYFRHLTEIHPAPRWLWSALVEKLVADDLTVNDTRRLVAVYKNVAEPLPWLDAPAVARALVSEEMREGEITKIGEAWEKAHSAIEKAAFNAGRHKAALDEALARARPARLARVLEVCKSVLDAQADEIAAEHEREAKLRENELSEQRHVQERERRISGLRTNVSLEAWKELDEPTKALLLDTSLATGSASFNEQKNDAIEWAQWSWNPVTGCDHICPYCYAREIARVPGWRSCIRTAFVQRSGQTLSSPRAR
jgi:ParB/RepB/Spo0J family partition protein